MRTATLLERVAQEAVMRRGWPWLGGVLLLSALLVTPWASAANGALDLTAELPIRADGNVTTTTSHGTFLLEGDSGEVALLAHGPGSLELVTDRVWGVVEDYNADSQVVWHSDLARETIVLGERSMQLVGRDTEFMALAFDSSIAVERAADAGPVQVDEAGPRHIEYAKRHSGQVDWNAPPDGELFVYDLPHPALLANLASGTLRLDTGDRLFLQGLRLVLDDGTEIVAQRRIEQSPGGAFDPTTNSWFGPGTHTELVQQYVVLRLDEGGGVAELTFGGISASLTGSELTLQVTGLARVPAARGTVAVPGDDHDLAGQDLTLTGRFALVLNETGGAVRATGSGDFTHLAYGAVEEPYDWSRTVVAVGLGALAVGLLAWVAHLAGPSVVAGYARVTGDDILDHPVRRESYDLVRENPGITAKELEAAFDVSTATLAFHLRVLERNGFVVAARSSRATQFFDRRAGTFAGGQRDVAAMLSNPVSGRIARAVRTHEGLAQRELAEELGLAPSTINWHMQRLGKVGLVREERVGRRTCYFAGPGWSTAAAQAVERTDSSERAA